MNVPEWLKTARRVWQEDDARPEGAETLSEAWQRLVGTAMADLKIMDRWDGPDEFCVRYANGYVASWSQLGNEILRVKEC